MLQQHDVTYLNRYKDQVILELSATSHFPWFDMPDEVGQIFIDFEKSLKF